jgi:hypothetical protein
MWTRAAVGALSVALLATCSGTGTMANPGADESEIGSVRLFDTAGTDLTQHMALFAGHLLRVEVRMYAVNGQQVTDVPGGVEVDFSFTPSSVASSAPVAAEALTRDVTPGTGGGGLTVSLRFVADDLTKTFGPFDVLVH